MRCRLPSRSTAPAGLRPERERPLRKWRLAALFVFTHLPVSHTINHLSLFRINNVHSPVIVPNWWHQTLGGLNNGRSILPHQCPVRPAQCIKLATQL